jgi:hypothetical protein
MAARKRHEFHDHIDADIQTWDAGDGIPSDKDLDKLETALKMRVPKEYRRFQRLHGAVMVAASDEVWPNSELGKSGPFWTFLKGFTVLGLGEECPDYMDIRAVTAQFHDDFPGTGKWIPFFAHNETADYYCFDKAGRILLWSHEDPGAVEDQEVGFDQFVVHEAKLLVLRKNAVRDALARYGKKWRERVKSPG